MAGRAIGQSSSLAQRLHGEEQTRIERATAPGLPPHRTGGIPVLGVEAERTKEWLAGGFGVQ